MKSGLSTRASRGIFLLVLSVVGIVAGWQYVFAAGEPVVTNQSPTQVLPESVVLNGTVTDEGAAPVIGIWAEYGTTDSYGSEVQRYNLNELTLPGTFDVSLSGLTCDTTYHYRLRARNNALLDGYSPDATFKTSECYQPDTISHWTLDEQTGTREDIYGSNDLIPTNNPGPVEGVYGSAASLTAEDGSHLIIADNPSLSTGGGTSFTVSLWVQLYAKTGTQVFVSKYGSTSTGEYAVYFENSEDRFMFSTYGNNTSYAVAANQLGSPQVGTWYHIVATHDAVNGTNSIIVDDVYINTITGVSEHQDSSGAFVIGAFGASASFPADAIVDDVRFAKSAVDVPEEPEPVAFAGGTGTELDPYEIQTCEQLQAMNQDLIAHYELTSDVDCSASATWNPNTDEWQGGTVGGTLIPDSYSAVTNNGYYGFKPIGQDSEGNGGFRGSFNGNGHTISNLWIFRKTTDYVGLFGYASNNVTISNLVLSNAQIVGKDNTGGVLGYGDYALLDTISVTGSMVRAYLAYQGGGVAGQLVNGSHITNSTVSTSAIHGSGNIIGGFVGYLENSSVEDSTSSANVDGGEYIGGAVGRATNSVISRVTVTGDVDSNDSENEIVNIVKSGQYTGGLIGYSESTNVFESEFSGQVTAEGDYAGGIGGFISAGVFDDVISTGNVSGKGVVGGFAGNVTGLAELSNTIASGTVTATEQYAGGFAAIASCGVTINESAAFGNVSGTDYVGGFTGMDGCEGPGAYYTEVAAHGNVVASGGYAGGFVGQSSVSEFTDVYADGTVTAADRIGSFAGAINAGTVNRVYARGVVTPGGMAEYTGAFAGEADNMTIANSFVDTQAVGLENVCGIGTCEGITALTTILATTQSTYENVGWNFTTPWVMGDVDDQYPHFPWEENGFIADISVTTNPATNITQTSATLNGTITAGSANAYGFFVGTESHSDGSMPPLDQNIFTNLIALYPATIGDGGPTTVPVPFPYSVDAPGFECGTTYYYRALVYANPVGQYETFTGLGLGAEQSFTTLACGTPEPEPEQETPAPVIQTTGGGRAWGSGAASASTPAKSTNSTPNTCPADQILTQNMRAGARDGKYHPYTKAIVKEVKILQGHMNRLGFNSGKIDGILGKITDGAIKRMQTYLGTVADGLIGPKTRALINNSCGDKGLQKTL